MLEEGLVVKINSEILTVSHENNDYQVLQRGKLKFQNNKPLVGDKVIFDKEKLVIEKILERKNCLPRPNVANIDVALVVTSVKKPTLSLSLLDKLISVITINNIEPYIVFTKLDLLEKDELKSMQKLQNYYEKIGIKTFKNEEISKLKKALKNKTVCVCGQTGAGKSTLINRFSPALSLKTDDISTSLGRGKHTTRLVELFKIDDFYIADTPGFSSLFINNYKKEEIRDSFREFRNRECQFKDCFHDKEKGCQVREAVLKGDILASRYENYLNFKAGDNK